MIGLRFESIFLFVCAYVVLRRWLLMFMTLVGNMIICLRCTFNSYLILGWIARQIGL